MRFVSLYDKTGLELMYEKQSFSGCGSDKALLKETLTLENVRSQLLNQELTCPESYGEVYNIDSPVLNMVLPSVRVSIIILWSILLGIEFPKTRAVKAEKPYYTYIYNLYGDCIVLGHKITFNEDLFEYYATSVFEAKLKPGEYVFIPPGYGYTIISPTLKETIVLKAVSKDYYGMHVFDTHKGAAVYYIHKNSKIERVLNPYFKKVDEKTVVNSKWLEQNNLHGLNFGDIIKNNDNKSAYKLSNILSGKIPFSFDQK